MASATGSDYRGPPFSRTVPSPPISIPFPPNITTVKTQVESEGREETRQASTEAQRGTGSGGNQCVAVTGEHLKTLLSLKIFVETSPHHLDDWGIHSAYAKGIDLEGFFFFEFLGLIRPPPPIPPLWTAECITSGLHLSVF